MIFDPLPLSGAYCLKLEPFCDERGYFARVFCKEEFSQHGLNPHLEQCSLSFNQYKGTLRGMHWQEGPFEESKLVTCVQGSIYDVIIDLRKNSKTYLQWTGVELSDKNGQQLYVPEGVAHGFQTLESHTKVLYQISAKHNPSAARGLRFDDPLFSIIWPFRENLII